MDLQRRMTISNEKSVDRIVLERYASQNRNLLPHGTDFLILSHTDIMLTWFNNSKESSGVVGGTFS